MTSHKAYALSPSEIDEAARRLDLLGCGILAAALRSDEAPDLGLLVIAESLLHSDPATLTRSAAIHWLERLDSLTIRGPAERAGDQPRFSWSRHANDLGDSCPHSAEACPDGTSGDDAAAACPAGCRSSYPTEDEG